MTAHDADGRLLATLSITGRAPIDMTAPVTIGRDPRAVRGEAVVVDGDPLVSKSHLAIDVEADGLVITDLGSSNGTFLHHGGRETAVPTDSWIHIPAGAEVEFGDQRMTIEMPTTPDPVVTNEAATPQHGIAAPVPPVAPADPWGAAEVAHAEATCSHCSRQLSPGSKFCDGCGTPTSAVAPAPVAGSVPAPADPGATVVVPVASAPPPIGPPAGAVPPSGASSPSAPGQPGAPAFVDLSSEPRTRRGPWKVVVAVVGAVVLLGVVGVVLSGVVGGDDDTGGDTSDLLAPETIDELWSESVRGESTGAFADDAGVYVATADFSADRLEVVAFDRQTGDELWETELDVDGGFADLGGVTQGVLLAAVCDAECTMVGIDVSTGDELWTEEIGDGFPQVTDRHVISADDESVAIFDPLTGDRVERVRGDDVLIGNDHVLVSDGDDVEVFDFDLNRLLGPESVDRADAVAFDGSRLIVAEGDELRFIDADGTVIKTSTVDVGAIDEVRPVTDDNIILSSDEGVISIDPLDGTADERWSERGELSSVARVDGGAVVLVDEGGILHVIDAGSGEQRFERDLEQPDGGFTFATRNLLVVYEFDGFEDPVELSAFDWETGEEAWSERFEDFPIVLDGLVVEATRDGDVVAYG